MHLPHLLPFETSTIVFITTCTKHRAPLLARPDSHTILHDIWARSSELNGWFVGHYVIMPDHVHLFAAPGIKALPLPAWMQLWKAIAAKRINRTTGKTGSLWQDDYFDRFIRSRRDYEQKWAYFELNPVRGGLVLEPEEWPYRGIIHDIRHRSQRDW